MTKPNSEWQTQKLATIFLDNVRGAIPGAALQLEVIGKIAQCWCDNPTQILDLGCGNGILGRYLLNLFPSSQGVFVDFSDPMLEAAHKNLNDEPRANILKADFSSPQWLEVTEPHQPFDLIVSGFAIHHLPDERKNKLYAEVHEHLSPNGVFLNLEHVSSATPAGEKLFDEFFIDHLYTFQSNSNPKTTRKEVADTFYNRPDKKENILAPVETQCQWLREIGFTDVDCFFKVFELAVFGGRRNSDTRS